jgi:Protein of unknown function (DUF2442)
MPHPIDRVTGFEIVGPHRLTVTFNDGTQQHIDFRPVLYGPMFGPLQDLLMFNGVVLDAEAGTLVWPNGADFDPVTLHDWPSVCAELASRAQVWARRQPSNRVAG